MTIEIKNANPVIGSALDAKRFVYYVKHWTVTGYTWDGSCMCTKKDFNIEVEYPHLDCSRRSLERLVRESLSLVV